MQKLITKAGQPSFFVLVSVPLACTLYLTANGDFGAKRIFKMV